MPLPTLQRLNALPQFGNLSFDSQQRLRQVALLKDLQENLPQFFSLRPTLQRKAIEGIMQDQKPVYQNKEFQITANDFLRRIENGDRQAMLQFLNNIRNRQGMKAGMIAAGAGLIGMKFAEWMNGKGNRNTYAQYATSDFLTGSDADKFYSYASRNIFKDNSSARETMQNAMRTVSATAGPLAFVADIAAMWGGSVAVAGSKAVVGAVRGATATVRTAQAAGKIGPALSRVATWGARVGIPATADALLGGTFGVARENVIALANKEPDRMTDTVREVARSFGEYAAWDIVLGFTLPTLLPFIGGTAKRIFKRGDDLIRKPLPAGERKAFLEGLAMGDLSEAQRLSLTELGQDIFEQNKAIRIAGTKVEEIHLHPVLESQLAANSNNFILRQLDDGTVRLTKRIQGRVKGKPVVKHITNTYSSLLEANTEMANSIFRDYRTKWTKAMRESFDNNLINAPLKRMAVAINNVNEALDPLYQVGLTKADRALIKKGRVKGFQSPVQRISVTMEEADALFNKRPGSFRVDIGSPNEVASRLKETPRRFLQPGRSHILSVDKDPSAVKGLLITNTPVDSTVYQYADNLVDRMLRKNPLIQESKENLRTMFLLQQGYDSRLIRNPDGTINAIETFIPNRVRILRTAEVLSAKPDISQAKRSVHVGNNAIGQRVVGDSVITNELGARRYWSQFTNRRKLKNLTKILDTNNFSVYKTEYGKYQLELPEVGISREFDSLKDAEQFAREKWTNMGKVLSEAEERGLTVTFRKGLYEFMTPEGTSIVASTEDDIKKVFQEYAEPTAAPEIFDELQDDFTITFEDIIDSQEQGKVPPGTMKADLRAPDSMVYNGLNGGNIRINARQQLKRVITQTDAWVEDVALGNRLPEVYENYHNMRRSVRIKNGQFHEALEYVYNDVFTSASGKQYWKPKYRDRRILMYYHIAGKGDDISSRQIYEQLTGTTKGGPLNAEEIQITERLEELYDTLATRFGISADRFIKNYQPRIIKYINDPTNTKKLVNSPMAEGVIPDIFAGGNASKVPGEIKAWFHEARTSEFLQFFVEDDAMMGIIKYLDRGLAVEHIKPAWEQLSQILRRTGDISLTEHMGRYAQKALNSFHSAGEEVMRKIGNTWFEQLNKRATSKGSRLGKMLIPKDGGDMMSVLYTLNYLTNMAYRPWLAVRNAFQIWTTLGPRIGNDAVSDAVKLTHKQIKEGDNLIESLRHLGVLDRRPPIRGELGGLGTRLNRLSNNAFKMFKGSDDYTRLIAFNAANVKLMEANDLIRTGKINLQTKAGKETFLEISGLRKTDPYLAEELFQKTVKAFEGPVEDVNMLASVRLTWGQKLIDDTMFIYDAAQSPMMFDGIVGKAFGRYGTYSVGYRANLWRGLQYGNASDKIGFISRFIGNQAALWATFSALGIKATNFIPGQPSLFTGGPMFDLGLNLIRAADVSSYQGRQARGELLNSLNQLVPGSMQHRYLKKAIEYSDKGDWWKAFLSITSTPVLSGPFLE